MNPTSFGNQPSSLVVRSVRESDLDGIEEMINDFAVGHPAANHSRSPSKLREAYLGDSPVAHLIVASRGDLPVGMAQWTRIYEMFWNVYGARVDWLYVRPQFRRSGIVTAIVCAQVRAAEGEFLYGGGGDEVEPLYERFAIGGPTNECHLSAEAFQAFADLAGLPPRTIVRRIPAVELNRVAAVVRSSVA
jgi:hypothetical protein